MRSNDASLVFAIVAYNAAGMIKDEVATAMRDDMVEATVELNFCSWNFSPPKRKHMPKTSKMLDKILPSILA